VPVFISIKHARIDILASKGLTVEVTLRTFYTVISATLFGALIIFFITHLIKLTSDTAPLVDSDETDNPLTVSGTVTAGTFSSGYDWSTANVTINANTTTQL
jgi:hypothetical protein